MQLAAQRLARPCCLRLVAVGAVRRGCVVRQRAQQLGCLRGVETELALDRGDERGAAPLEHAREVADGSVGDRKRRAIVADRDRHDGSRLFPGGGRTDGAQQGERLQVDRSERDAGRLAGLDVAVDRVAVRGRQDDAAERSPDSSTVSETTW